MKPKLGLAGLAKPLSMLAILCALVALAATNAFAQAETGQIVGAVTDPSGALVPGAKVTVKSVATGAVRSQVTSDTGAFTFTNLLPDVYDVTVEASGFANSQQRTTVAVGAKGVAEALFRSFNLQSFAGDLIQVAMDRAA